VRESIHLTRVHPVARKVEGGVNRAPLIMAAEDGEAPLGRPQLTRLEGGVQPLTAPAERSLIYLSRQPCEELSDYLGQRGWRVHCARSLADAARLMRGDEMCAGLVDVVNGFGNRDLGALEGCLRHATVGWVAMTPSAQLDDLAMRRLIRNYCFDYVKTPCTNESLNFVLGHAFGMIRLSDIDIAQSVAASGDDEMVGTCDAMQQLFRTIRKLGNTDASVFIAGESGTGKELTALAIHERSERRKAPFVAINCGAIPHHLLQSELFGYERGAFTGANQRKIGRVESASGGTLFLDEIGDLPLESQAALLRFLQEGKI
jgi:DNA-binding NtrC family response regulator